MKKKKLNKIKLACTIIILSVIAYFVFDLIVAKTSRVVEDIPEVEIKENAIVDEEKPDDVIYVKMNNENKILSCYCLGEFENGQTLSSEYYLKAAYSALNNGFVESKKTTFSEEEINNIVYSIFGVQLPENTSIENFEYKDGKYILKKTEKQNVTLENLERGTAAGSTFLEYEIDGDFYIAKITTNTVTGENYIQSIRKD